MSVLNRSVLRQTKCFLRRLSTQKFVSLDVDSQNIATLTLQRPPVNVFDRQLLEQMKTALGEVETRKPKGMIITSIFPEVFSAGMDLTEWHKPDLERFQEYCTLIHEVRLQLYGLKCTSAVAINGHGIGGSCMMALSCDYRVMVNNPKYRMGLNETELGIAVPVWLIELLREIIPSRQVELALTSARLFTVEEALEVGIIDQMAKDKAEAIEICKQYIEELSKISPDARAKTKLQLRQPIIDEFRKSMQHYIDIDIMNLKEPAMQKMVEKHLASLKRKT